MLFKYLFIFASFSFVGWVMELCYRSYRTKNIVNPGFMSGCVVPLYGLGALILTILSQVLPEPNSIPKLIFSFFVSMICLTGLELFSAYTNLKFYKLKLWDYSDEKLNYKGFICLKFSIIWGLLSILFRLAIYPGLNTFTETIVKNYVCIFMLGIFYGIFIIDLFASINLSRRIHKYSNIIKDYINLENLKLDLKLQDKKRKFVNSVYPYITTNSYLKDKINEIKDKKN